jgi:hypothetical protein
MSKIKKLSYIVLDVIICVCLCVILEKEIGKVVSIAIFSTIGTIVMIVIATDRPI